ncbi:hypothetical protein QRX50_22515 [Amycolatopsis carbonis]|uniref:Uncharacterized protein n=1 Tax=Amycolatopsis carbonis TaxID=715471 RepID=A0A9Y2IQI7_9PSEU|nr:hypothetical protein [Amycolatopsis sp. 2-15]WIX83331.1 hypothetical protein QRX50_22515 [Amycolatopsis sp. 2-15]
MFADIVAIAAMVVAGSTDDDARAVGPAQSAGQVRGADVVQVVHRDALERGRKMPFRLRMVRPVVLVSLDVLGQVPSALGEEVVQLLDVGIVDVIVDCRHVGVSQGWSSAGVLSRR